MNGSVIIMMGSEKDMDFASRIIQKLKENNIDNEVHICSAHKNTLGVLNRLSELDIKYIL